MARDGAPSGMRRSQFRPSSSCPVVKVQRARRAHVEFDGWADGAAAAPEGTAYRRALSRIREVDKLVRVANHGHAAVDVEVFTPRPASAARNPSTSSGVAGIEPGKPC